VEPMFVTIVIPVFNEEKYISACLQSVSCIDYPLDKLQVVVVDNGSTDKTLVLARGFNVEIFVKENVNVGGVRNFGASKATGEILVFLDSDCIVEPEWLTDGISIMNSGLDAAGGLYLLRDNPSWIESGWLLKSSRKSVYQKTFVGGCIFIKKTSYDAVGGFNEKLSAGEDTDLTYRLLEAGKKITINPTLNVTHLGYPKTVSSFVKRQIWHSEDCYQKLPGGLTDRVFIITQLCILGGVVAILSIAEVIPYDYCWPGLLILLLSPAVLTVKRFHRYRVKNFSAGIVLKAYIVDSLYLIGRIMGSLRSLKKLISKKNVRKYDRR
jgi:glycosyltransferase involved in cell wall biosynthesis